MLVLSRKCGERLRIGDNVTITVLSIQPGKVRIGINAPKEIVVDREEVWLDKKKNQEDESDGD